MLTFLSERMMMREILNYARAQTPEMIRTLRQMVEIESPSSEPDAINRLAGFLVDRFAPLSREVDRIPVSGAGDLVRARTGRGEGAILVLGHMDTVWPLSTLRDRPVRIEGEKLYGPGSFDMKGGLTVALFALKTLHALDLRPERSVTFLFTSLEEVGGRPYRHILEREARRCQSVLVLEPPLPGGAVKTARKGTARLILRVHGRSAHAGLAPEEGVNAIIELAHQLVRLASLNEWGEGLSVNVGVIRGGRRANVVPDRAEAEIDIRFSSLEQGKRAIEAIGQFQPILDGAEIEVLGDLSVPPMERTEAIVSLYQRARAIAARLGFDLPEGAAGGASEGSYTAAWGIPTLDGLGPDGDGAHAAHEHVLIPSLAERTALLAALLLKL
ncbi:MAG: M20 family peptidase [Acidobacteria bacterium]|nr:MAG: M20 family peptidase [Acidobacteriota bacterium]